MNLTAHSPRSLLMNQNAHFLRTTTTAMHSPTRPFFRIYPYTKQSMNRSMDFKARSVPPQDQQSKPTTTATDVALAYYTNYNNKNIDAVLDLIDDHCEYQDLIYNKPFQGKKEIASYFKKIEQLVPQDIKFVVEDITIGDPYKVGVRWHVELDKVAEFPFSRGVSFYEINKEGKIIFARDIVEPTIKPGASALGAISVLAPVVRSLGPAADPSNLPDVPLAAVAMIGFYMYYIYYVLLGSEAPGVPAWQTSPETLQAVLHESFNFFYVNILAAQFDMNPVPSVAGHPVDEALFNFVNAWSLMWWPLWCIDSKGVGVRNKGALWVATMFLTNVFAPIYMTLRLIPDDDGKEEKKASLPGYAPVFGGISLGIGLISFVWAAMARPEYGGIPGRLDYFMSHASSDRVFWAFLLDCGLYAVWQAWILGDAEYPCKPWHRYVPFFGLCGYLLKL